MKTVLKYPGAKNRIADWICSYIPAHDVYLEPYAGSLAVFFNKMPARIETLNDLDGEVVNYFREPESLPSGVGRGLDAAMYIKTGSGVPSKAILRIAQRSGEDCRNG